MDQEIQNTTTDNGSLFVKSSEQVQSCTMKQSSFASLINNQMHVAFFQSVEIRTVNQTFVRKVNNLSTEKTLNGENSVIPAANSIQTSQDATPAATPGKLAKLAANAKQLFDIIEIINKIILFIVAAAGYVIAHKHQINYESLLVFVKSVIEWAQTFV